ncbi:hypothetical protein GCM10029978_067710 [Actinoallomurus acanthiterrae]
MDGYAEKCRRLAVNYFENEDFESADASHQWDFGRDRRLRADVAALLPAGASPQVWISLDVHCVITAVVALQRP